MSRSDLPFSLSVVSHGQAALVRNLLVDLRSAQGAPFEIILTHNIPEDRSYLRDFSDLPITVVENDQRKGFGANHNAAFRRSKGERFIILNPDIRAPGLDLAALQTAMSRPRLGAYAPLVLSPTGSVEDSARRMPTVGRLAARVLLGRRQPDYAMASEPLSVDWTAGMFVAFPRASFEAVSGFDEGYFMYMEDADICRRLRAQGFEVVIDPRMQVVHDARRASRRSLRHLSWHLRSAVRFFTGM